MTYEIDKIIVQFAAPTLAGIKAGNLFGIHSECLKCEIFKKANSVLEKKGISLRVLERRGKTFLYIYRRSELNRILQDESVWKILNSCGYKNYSIDSSLSYLEERMRLESRVPDEIGLFLGYPPKDVESFMRHKGKNCRCIGCWKVYNDEDSARKKFAQLKKCEQIYRKCLDYGFSLSRLTVST